MYNLSPAHNQRHNIVRIRKENGFTLIEALVALVIVSFGMISIAGLLVQGMRWNTESTLRSKAIFAAQAMAERIRANGAGVTAGSYNALTTPPGASIVPTNPAQVASQDYYLWTQDLSQLPRGLPNGSGVVCLDSTPTPLGTAAAPACDGLGTALSIKIFWDERAIGGATNPQQFTMSFIP